MVPIWLNIFQDCPNNHNENSAPATAIGTVKMIINGSIKLSNCAASIKNISNKAKPKANNVLELLSTKSLDSPPKSVVKDSSKTLSFIRSMASIPSLMVFPGAKFAETVADM